MVRVWKGGYLNVPYGMCNSCPIFAQHFHGFSQIVLDSFKDAEYPTYIQTVLSPEQPPFFSQNSVNNHHSSFKLMFYLTFFKQC